jgi:heat shock protein HslJ
MRRAPLSIAIASAALIVAGCNMLGIGGGGTGGAIEGVRWLLTDYRVDGTATPVPAGVTADASFAGGTVSGSGGCNSFTATYTVDGAKLTIGDPASTLMLCDGPAGVVETAYFTALPSVASFTATADILTLFDGSGNAVLEYAAGPADPLAGSWIVTGYNTGDSVDSPIADTELTATFENGAVSGSSGCNTYNGTYTLTGTTLAIGPLASTQKACDQPIMDQETAFLAALQGATGVRTDGANVTLTSADGSNAVTLTPAS